MPELKEVTLETVAAGAASELFAHELEKVIENLRDPNTSPKEKRLIRVDVVFTPHESQGRRDEAAVQVKVSSRLAGVTPASGFLFMGREDGKVKAYTHDVRQEELITQAPPPSDEVIDMKHRRPSGA